MQSLFNKREILEAFIHDNNNKYQALCITETWLSKTKADFVCFEGYNLVASFHRENHRGGGVCIILKDNIEYIEVKNIMNMSIEYIIEMCAVEILNYDILLIVIYWNGKETDIFYRQLKLTIEYIMKKYKNKKIIMGGDFNINILEKNKQSLELIDFMLESSLKQHIK